MKDCAPVAVFAFRRADHLKRTLDALRANPEAAVTDLVVFSDGPRDARDEAGVAAVRRMVRGIDGFRSVCVQEASGNLGLSRSIVGGVGRMVAERDRVIVLEDDLVTSPSFLRFMNDALDRYADDERVASVHGYIYPVREPLPPAFFLRGADCWGWATWARAWKLYDADGASLFRRLRERRLEREFDFDGSYPFTRMLRNQIAGRNDSWAIRWYASAFLADRLTLYPGISLVQNIGNDGSGTHGGSTATFDVNSMGSAPLLDNVQVQHDMAAAAAIARYFRWQRRERWIQRVRRWVGGA